MAILTFTTIIILLTLTTPTYACDETIKLGDSTFTISDEWCGQSIDTNLLPAYEDLGRIPFDYTFDSSKIYIRKEARDAYVRMAEAAAIDSVNLVVQSGYRSRGYQASLVKRRMTEGKSFIDVIKFVAPPGYSRHELGYSVDFKAVGERFSQSRAYKWLLENASTYNFTETYPKENEHLKAWEPWHWEYEDKSILVK